MLIIPRIWQLILFKKTHQKIKMSKKSSHFTSIKAMKRSQAGIIERLSKSLVTRLAQEIEPKIVHQDYWKKSKAVQSLEYCA